MAALITTERAKHADALSGVDNDILLALIDAASTAIERYCNRTFAKTTYREFFDGMGDCSVVVTNTPITDVSRVCCNYIDAITIENTGSGNQRAYATVNDETSLALTYTASGSSTTETLAFSDYATLTLLVAAANALGTGWTASAATGYGDYPSADLVPVAGLNAADGQVYLEMPDEPATGLIVDEAAGIIHLPSRPPERPRQIEVKYSAGYVTIPHDVQEACVQMVIDLYSSGARADDVSGMKLGDYSETYRGGGSDEGSAPPVVRSLLATYRSYPI